MGSPKSAELELRDRTILGGLRLKPKEYDTLAKRIKADSKILASSHYRVALHCHLRALCSVVLLPTLLSAAPAR